MEERIDSPSRRDQLFQQFVERTVQSVLALDSHGVVFFANRSACAFTGYSTGELVGSPLTTILDPDDFAAVTAQVLRTVRTGTTVGAFKTRIRAVGGDVRIASLDIYPLVDTGDVVGTIVTIDDLTSRAHAERQYHLLESIVDHAREAIMITDAAAIDTPGPRIQYVNKAFTDLTEYQSDEVVGTTPWLLHGDGADGVAADEIRDALVRQRPAQVELLNHRKNQSAYWTNVSILPVPDHLVAFQIDVTDRRQQEIAVERRRADLDRRLKDASLSHLFPGRGAATTTLRRQIVDAARSRRLPVVILGDRGTGKALVAREIHRLSPRAAGPFVPVDCTAIPSALFESEMFGHEKGAFTGATTMTRGLFQQADSGTLFLDEIGELSLEQQAKLLVVIQERRVRRVGAATATAVDVRIIAATNRDLDRMTADGQFRADLYDRIRGFLIDVPSLKERADDLELYVDRFVERWADEEGKTIADVDVAVLEAFRRYSWPGNIRELEFVIGRMIARADDDRLTIDLLPAELSATSSSSRAGSIHGDPNPRKEYSAIDVAEALERHHGVVRRAARDLGIARNTLYRLMEKHGLRRMSRDMS